MSLLSVFLLAQLYAIYVSAAALPVSSSISQIWDMQRATNFDVFLTAALKDTVQASDTKLPPGDTELAPARPTKTTKRKTTTRKFKTKPLPSITDIPMGGMQCTIM